MKLLTPSYTSNITHQLCTHLKHIFNLFELHFTNSNRVALTFEEKPQKHYFAATFSRSLKSTN